MPRAREVVWCSRVPNQLLLGSVVAVIELLSRSSLALSKGLFVPCEMKHDSLQPSSPSPPFWNPENQRWVLLGKGKATLKDCASWTFSRAPSSSVPSPKFPMLLQLSRSRLTAFVRTLPLPSSCSSSCPSQDTGFERDKTSNPKCRPYGAVGVADTSFKPLCKSIS